MTATMKAVVLHAPGGPEALQVERVPIPEPAAGDVLIRVKAFGINRSEMFTRRGESPNVRLPRVLGIEAAGIVEACPSGEFAAGETVLTAMGGMGREIDGGYAEFVRVPASHARSVTTELPWDILGAIPEMLQTAWGSLFRSLRLKPGETLLVRGGTTSVGLAATAIARAHRATVVSTSRDVTRETLVKAAGADRLIVDDGAIATRVRQAYPGGVDKVLELVGITTLADSMACVKPPGILCMTGIVGNQHLAKNFGPMAVIPSAVRFTTYAGESEDFMATPYQELLNQIAARTLHVQIGRTFRLDEIVAAHRLMDGNGAGGKIVVLT